VISSAQATAIFEFLLPFWRASPVVAFAVSEVQYLIPARLNMLAHSGTITPSGGCTPGKR
jgi:hypothetical protein